MLQSIFGREKFAGINHFPEAKHIEDSGVDSDAAMHFLVTYALATGMSLATNSITVPRKHDGKLLGGYFIMIVSLF